MNKIRIDLLPNYFRNSDGTFNKKEAIMLSGKIAGICYDKEGFSHLENEDEAKTLRRIDMTLNNGHHSVYDHIMINFNLQNVPKILAMVLNNEKEYTTSEKSARYTPVERKEGSPISSEEERLYHKWVEILTKKIKCKYEEEFSESKIRKLAQENARYFVSVFMPTQMIYSTSLRQINYIVSWMKKYIENANTDFEIKLAQAMEELIEELERLNVLEEGLLQNEKHRSLSLFGKNLNLRDEYFGDVYSTKYYGSFAELAQAHRHRTLDYQIELSEDNKEFFIPTILEDDDSLIASWNDDMKLVQDVYPQGQLVLISERGTYENFILKCKERLCTAAQMEIMEQTRCTLLKYQKYLSVTDHHLKEDILKYMHGARCTFPDFVCKSSCNFKEGITLTRKI